MTEIQLDNAMEKELKLTLKHRIKDLEILRDGVVSEQMRIRMEYKIRQIEKIKEQLKGE